ncbi:MAG: hypothetical protein JKY01_13560 [Pseudomonadales bacterium]|nr:hypothetical protein [Pseudomonadales bacterium]
MTEKVMTLYCDSQVSHGSADTIEVTTLPMPSTTSAMGKAQHVVPSSARPKPPSSEELVLIFSIFILVS